MSCQEKRLTLGQTQAFLQLLGASSDMAQLVEIFGATTADVNPMNGGF